MPPQGSNLVLSSDIPHRERDVLVLDRLDVEACHSQPRAPLSMSDLPRVACRRADERPRTHTDGRDGGNNLSELELVQDGRFTRSVESDHKDSCMSVEWSVHSRVEVSCARAGDVDDVWSLGRVVYEIEGDFPSPRRTHLLLAEEALEQFADGETHVE